MDKPPCTSNDFDVIELGSSDDERLEGYGQSNGGPLGFASFLKEECATSQTKTLLNLVDASYELVDPSPNIHELFVTFDHQFFWGTLNSNACIVEWSKTMTSCAGLCRFSVGNRLCSIRLSEPLLKLRPRRDLVETLLHEMIHAYQFVTNGIQDRDGHGPDFQSHMHRINKLAGTSITVYHSFHAEVAHYKQHWWRCTGPCKDRPPFFGWVKRAMNRAPSANDLWWTTHQASCSGNFVKVKEPEKKEKATKINVKKSPKNRKRSSETETTQQKIDIFFPGKGYVLGNEAVTTSAFMEEERRGPSNSQSTSTVDGETEKPVAKRKRRTKEEIEQERLNKEVNKVCRQIQSAKNTKCEQYLFCHFSSKILCLNDNLAVELEKRFEERGITEQIVYDKSHNNLMQVFWLKKRLEAFLEDGKLHKNEKMELQNVFCCVLSGETYSVLVKSRGNSMMDYLDEQMATVRQKISGDPQLTVVVFGTHHVRENTVSSLIFEAFEKHRIQFRFVSDAFDFSFLIAQYHRALAKMEKKAEKQILVEQSDLSNGTHFVAEKGIADGPSMVSDWWEKMLEHLHRMSEEQKRAIMEAHPNPYKLMEWLLEPDNTAGQAMFALSEIQMESGRRLGPVLAQKIYKMLTSRTGTESTE